MFPKIPIIQITTHYRNAVIERVVGTFSDIFGNVRKSSENRRKRFGNSGHDKKKTYLTRK